MTKRCAALAALLVALPGCRTPEGRELQLSFYGGRAVNANGDLDLRQPPDTNLRIHGVKWEDKSFVAPIYYGVRLAYWFGEGTRWGAAIDFSHPKAIVNESQVTNLTGVSRGVPTNGPQTIRNHLERFEMSHGLNLLTLNLMHRWFPEGKRDMGTFWGRVQPYLGAGAGLSIPHVEATVAGVDTDEYQIAGPAAQAFAGAHFDVWGPVGAFLEYKLSFADSDMDLTGGGRIRTQTWTSQFIFGLSVRF